MADYYAVLGVNPSAEDIVIRAAYKALAQRYHPDRYAGSKEEAHRRMSEITRAYEVLADPVCRPKYDRRRSMYTRAVAARFSSARKFAAAALHPRGFRAGVAMRNNYRNRYHAALAALMSVVVVLSVFNVFHHSGQIKEWLGWSTAGPATIPISQANAVVVDSGSSFARPSKATNPPVAVAVPAARSPSVREKKRSTKNAASDRPARGAPVAVASEPCQDVVAARGLCTPDKPAKSR